MSLTVNMHRHHDPTQTVDSISIFPSMTSAPTAGESLLVTPTDHRSLIDCLSSAASAADVSSSALDFTDNGGQQALAFDTSVIPYPGQLQSIAAWEIIVKVLMYGVIILVSLVGNSLVVYIVWKNKRMHTTTNFFIVNLAVSDVMVTSSCTWVHLVDSLTEGWVLGAFFCKFNSFAQGQVSLPIDFVV